jgi:hypothetical protein
VAGLHCQLRFVPDTTSDQTVLRLHRFVIFRHDEDKASWLPKHDRKITFWQSFQ